MKSQITIVLKNKIYLIPKFSVELKYFDEIKIIQFGFLFVLIHMKLYKRNNKPWIKK